MSHGTRKVVLTAHVTTSLGWFGAVASFLVLAISGLVGSNAGTARAAYQAMDLVARWTILPLCGAALVSGLIQSVGTPWGLFRHYWVLVKLVLTLLATLVLLVHMQPIDFLAGAAVANTLAAPELRSMKIQLVVDAAGALFVLLASTVLAIYKPRGMTPYGWRKQHR